jgi:hypothetical protein
VRRAPPQSTASSGTASVSPIVFSGDVGEDLDLGFNVYRAGAKYYKAPVPCEVEWCG